jgi:hypothetical protein
MSDSYHIGTVKRNLNKNLSALFPAVHEEVSEALNGTFPYCACFLHYLIGSMLCRVPANDRGFVSSEVCMATSTHILTQNGLLCLPWTSR